MENSKETDEFVKLKDTYVYVVVDTVNIAEKGTDECVKFSDNRNDRPEIGPNFTSKVDKGRKITWCGIVKDAIDHKGDSVAIELISIKEKGRGSNILKDTMYEDENGDGVVVGKIKDKDESAKESYNITIRVNGADPIIIDPQLQMNQ